MKPYDPAKHETSRRKQEVQENEARRLKAVRAKARRAEFRKREQLALLTRRVKSLRAYSAKNAAQILNRSSKDELLELRKIAEIEFNNAEEKKRGSFAKVLNHIEDAEKFHNELALEKLHKRGSEKREAENRKLMAKVANRHALGRIVGGAQVVQFGASGSKTWATPRKRR